MFVELVASLIVAASPTYEASLRSEARASTTGDADGQLNPALSLKLPFGHFSLLVAYTPRILLFEPDVPQKISVLNTARLLAELGTGKAGRIFLQEDFSYGEASFSWLITAAEGGLPTFNSLARLPPFKYLGESTLLGIEQPVSRKVGISLSASYMVSGGADAEARRLSPFTHNPRFSFRVVWSTGTHDALLTGLDGYALFFPGTRTYAADLPIGWRHQFSPSTDGDLLVGVAGGRSITSELIETQLYPYFGATIRRKFLQGQHQSLWGSLSLRVIPAIDPITGVLYEQAESYGVLNYSPITKLTLIFALGGSVSLSTSVHQDFGVAGASASYQLSHHVALSAGARLFTYPSALRITPVAGPNRYQVQSVGFLAITVSEHGHL
jgi:hypothetical protein